MIFNSDAFFTKGSAHMICEDFAKSGRRMDGSPYAIVCDGCSSSLDTDTGARLLAHAASTEIQKNTDPSPRLSDFQLPIIMRASLAATQLNLEPTCLDSTLIAAYWSPDDRVVRVSMLGDGVVVARRRAGAARRRAGVWMFWEVEAENNAPNYLNYTLNNDRRERYIQKYGGMSKVKYFDSESGREPFSWPLSSNPSDWHFDAANFDLVMILSDGVQTFQERVDNDTNNEFRHIPIERIIENILNIPIPTGRFLQRRCRKFLSECDRLGWRHTDDFSVAAIWIGNPEDDSSEDVLVK